MDTTKPNNDELTQEQNEGVKKYEEELQKKRAYHREYMANRRKNEPEFAAKCRAANNRYKKEKYANDPEYRQYCYEYLKQHREKKNEYKALYDQLQK